MLLHSEFTYEIKKKANSKLSFLWPLEFFFSLSLLSWHWSGGFTTIHLIPLPTLGFFLAAVVVSEVCIVLWWDFRTAEYYSVLPFSLSICYFSFINFFFLFLCQTFFCIQLSIWNLSWLCFELGVGPDDSLCHSAHWKASLKLWSPLPALLNIILLWGNKRVDFSCPCTLILLKVPKLGISLAPKWHFVLMTTVLVGRYTSVLVS